MTLLVPVQELRISDDVRVRSMVAVDTMGKVVELVERVAEG